MLKKSISILLFTLYCSHMTCAMNPQILASVLAEGEHDNISINVTHVITTRIEEKLANGCYRQTIRETRSDNLNKTQETWVWICPPGTTRETILELECDCAGKCDCTTTTTNPPTTIITTKPMVIVTPNTTIATEILAHHLSSNHETTEKPENSTTTDTTQKSTEVADNSTVKEEEKLPEIPHHVPGRHRHSSASASSSMLYLIVIIAFISLSM